MVDALVSRPAARSCRRWASSSSEPVDEVGGATPDEARAAGASSVDEVVGGRTELPLYRIELSWGGPDPRDALSADTSFTAEQLAELDATLARWDARTP